MEYSDPIIDEIHAIRRKIFLEDCQGDPQKLLEYFQRIEAENAARVVEYEPSSSKADDDDAE